ncbi:unnamed protein product [Zymoseptoria tritici ST99CH_1E4]|uniref:Zn(2)-C6 fungal-type domain-containing protein n=1 Tax=Zymoseptoria tritici ST99CH_1E4 TaxID=1276532 RepID=A0A2H1FLN7_ZYMTR|nr:unnamed protein product [Zymoseptoria tritici ST99CH_1E4]
MPKTILISGAANGLGAAFVRRYEHDDTAIIAIDRENTDGQHGQNVQVLTVDVSSQNSINRLAKHIDDRSIDVVIHSAGVRGLVPSMEQKRPDNVAACETLEVMDHATMMCTFEINAAGTFMLLRALLPNLRKARGKVIVMASRMGSVGNNQRPNKDAGSAYAYRASKAALNTIVRSFAADVPEVTFVLVHPGRVDTKLVLCTEQGAISAEESVNGLAPLIDRWGSGDSGRYFDRFGEPIECVRWSEVVTRPIYASLRAAHMAPRSRTGCLTCRQRKLKCGEERPTCANCIKANRICVLSSGITFRHQQNPSMNGGGGSLSSFYGYKETFTREAQWVPVPKDLTFVHTSNPYEDELEDGEDASSLTLGTNQANIDHAPRRESDISMLVPTSFPAYAANGLAALSAIATQENQYSYAPPPVPSKPRLHPESDVPSLPYSNRYRPTAELANAARFNTVATIPRHDRRPAIDEPELAFLLRDYAERPGYWMDLFDLDLFFAAKVPVLAVTCPLLLYSCASLSAKSLARVEGRKPVMGGQTGKSRQSKMESWPGGTVDWVRKGREYYDIAVSLLRQSLEGASRPPTSSLPEDASPRTLLTVQGAELPTTDSDELVAATAILCVYEFLDASGPEWSRHLDGAKSLFDIAKDRMDALTLPPSPVSIGQQLSHHLIGQSGPDFNSHRKRLSQGRRGVFWNFARQDMLSAFINHTSTRLDTADIPMWHRFGLNLTAAGFVCPSNPQHPDYLAEQAMADDMVSNALIWLVMKLVNYIAAGDNVHESVASPLGLGIRQKELLDYWETLHEQIRVWHDGLPDGFHPAAIHHSDSECENERWFSRPMCASTMQWYHFAIIQLLHNKPHLTTATPAPGSPLALGSSLASRHASYAAILQHSRQHAKEIVAISMGRSDEGTRIHSVQPLWTAGLVLGNDDVSSEDGEVSAETVKWRRTIVGLLRGIERDMGWAAEYRVKNLLEQWSKPPDWPLERQEDG